MKKQFLVLSGLTQTDYPFSFMFHHRKRKRIKCKSMYTYDQSSCVGIEPAIPRRNIEIQITNYQELFNFYERKKGVAADVHAHEKFCQDMHIFCCDQERYINYSQIISAQEDAIFVAELWAMSFVYKLLTGIEKNALYALAHQKRIYNEFLTTCDLLVVHERKAVTA